MFKLLLLFTSVIAVLTTGGAATAQRYVQAGSLTLSGFQATCGPIATHILDIRDIAASYPGRIILSPAVFDLPRGQQIFWYMHECAHQIFGPGEAVADCWAVEQGRISGWLSPHEFERLAGIIGHWPGDATHASGGKRVKAMERCYYR